jgi:hypothetical protein
MSPGWGLSGKLMSLLPHSAQQNALRSSVISEAPEGRQGRMRLSILVTNSSV